MNNISSYRPSVNATLERLQQFNGKKVAGVLALTVVALSAFASLSLIAVKTWQKCFPTKIDPQDPENKNAVQKADDAASDIMEKSTSRRNKVKQESKSPEVQTNVILKNLILDCGDLIREEKPSCVVSSFFYQKLTEKMQELPSEKQFEIIMTLINDKDLIKKYFKGIPVIKQNISDELQFLTDLGRFRSLENNFYGQDLGFFIVNHTPIENLPDLQRLLAAIHKNDIFSPKELSEITSSIVTKLNSVVLKNISTSLCFYDIPANSFENLSKYIDFMKDSNLQNYIGGDALEFDPLVVEYDSDEEFSEEETKVEAPKSFAHHPLMGFLEIMKTFYKQQDSKESELEIIHAVLNQIEQNIMVTRLKNLVPQNVDVTEKDVQIVKQLIEWDAKMLPTVRRDKKDEVEELDNVTIVEILNSYGVNHSECTSTPKLQLISQFIMEERSGYFEDKLKNSSLKDLDAEAINKILSALQNKSSVEETAEESECQFIVDLFKKRRAFCTIKEFNSPDLDVNELTRMLKNTDAFLGKINQNHPIYPVMNEVCARFIQKYTGRIQEIYLPTLTKVIKPIYDKLFTRLGHVGLEIENAIENDGSKAKKEYDDALEDLLRRYPEMTREEAEHWLPRGGCNTMQGWKVWDLFGFF